MNYMKYCLKKLLLILLFCCFLVSCSEDFLEVVPRDQLSDVTVFSDESGADLFLLDIYNNLPDAEKLGGYHYDPFEAWGDNAVCKFSWSISWQKGVSRDYGSNTYNPGLYNHDYPALPFIYDRMYIFIRKCNLFIKKVNENSNNFSPEWSQKRIAEARFLRAYYYHLAWMAYGGLPIIEKPLNRIEMGDSIFYPRATFEQTFNYIVKELSEISDILPNEVGKGRVTKGAALTLKGWCELFAGRYNEAAQTNQAVMDLGTYKLFDDYNAQFMMENNNNEESIFAYQHYPASKPSGREDFFGPPGSYGGWGAMQPTQNLVDVYPMANGLPISHQESGYDIINPYKNRDPRFYASIIYDGCVFAGKEYSLKRGDLYDPNNEYQSGYFRRKGIGEHFTQATFTQDGANYIFFRYAEVLLNYAEAKIELNQIDKTVLDAINAVRIRGGIPSLEESYKKSTFSQDELREIVRKERQIEFAFENKRYWDLIRWRSAEIVLNQPVYGIRWNFSTNKYEKFVIHTFEFDKNKHYLFPMYQGWLDANPVMKSQNDGPDGWVNGQNPGY